MSMDAVGGRALQLFALLGTVALALAWHRLDPALASLLAAAAILLSGLPHGAFDRLIAVAFLGRHPGSRFATGLFLAAYLLIAAAVAVAWLRAPSFMLAAFLALSVVHFGSGDRGGSPFHRVPGVLAHGGAVIVLLPFFHPAEVTPIFAQLTDPDSARRLCDGLRTLAPVWLMVACMHATGAVLLGHGLRQPLELLALSVAFAVLPPLLGFLLYFGSVHAPRHVAASIAFLRSRGVTPRAVLTEVACLSLLALSGFVAAGFAMPSGPTGATVQRTLFIGLAALTVPHMLLVDVLGAWRRSRPDPDRQPGPRASP